MFGVGSIVRTEDGRKIRVTGFTAQEGVGGEIADAVMAVLNRKEFAGDWTTVEVIEPEQDRYREFHKEHTDTCEADIVQRSTGAFPEGAASARKIVWGEDLD
jgi:hypothetical protein